MGESATTVSQGLDKWDDPPGSGAAGSSGDKEPPLSLFPTAQKSHGLIMFSGIKSIFPCVLGCVVVLEHFQQP